ncbi:MAG: LLM class flavin-dependent oxidoreductase [Deltaproteobacteria bacterium]|nr:LLM class flavin-dependent oxidoreductase [Deltaproteobacteria bacterium]
MKIKIGFGLGTTAGAHLDGGGFWSIIDACESLGWDSIWFSERASDGTLGPLAALGAAAGRTRRLKFGTSVMVLPGRNPVLLAKELASIDVLSGGRLIAAFGLGVDGDPGEQQAFAVDRAEAAGRTREATELIRRLWTEPEVTHEGRYFRLHRFRLEPKPVQKPHPDIWFGGHSGAALRRTAEIGTGWLPSFLSPAEYRERADTIRALAAAAGRRIDEEHYGALVAYLGPGEPADAQRLLDVLAARRPGIDPRSLLAADGDGGLRERIEGFIAAGASKFVIVPLTPPRDWREELSRLHEAVVRPLEGRR